VIARVRASLRSPWLASVLIFVFLVWVVLSKGLALLPRYNLTASMPEGWYLPLPARPLERGEVVLACPPPWVYHLGSRRGYIPLLKGACPNGSVPFFKFVAGLPGDRLTLRGHRIAVNGCVLRHSRIEARDPSGRALPHRLHAGIIPWGNVLLLGNSRRSFDGRYFGLLPTGDVQPRPLFRLFAKQPSLRCRSTDQGELRADKHP